MVNAQRTSFVGTSNFGETLNAGEWSYLPSGNVLGRGIVETYHDVNSDARVTGTETIVSNAKFRRAPSSELGLAGNLWGTFHTENEGGVWDGTIISEITEGGEYFYRGVAHGSGGSDGLIVHWEANRYRHSGPFTLNGWILEPYSKKLGLWVVSKASRLGSGRSTQISLSLSRPTRGQYCTLLAYDS